MRYKVLLSFFLVILLSLVNLAQSSEQERPKIKNFGSSLRNDGEPQKSEDKKGKDADEDEPIRIETNLVVSDVLVLDKEGRAINGLQQSDFILTEDNTSQQIESFSLGGDTKIPRSIVLIIDYSGSQLAYIENSVEAAKVLVDKLNPEDRMAIVTDDVELIQQFTRDKTQLKEKLEKLKEKALGKKPGRSKQYSALMATLNELFDEEDVRPIVIFQTDGDEIQFIPQKNAKMPENSLESFIYKLPSPFTFEDLYTTIEKSKVAIYTVIPGYSLIGITPEERLSRLENIVANERAMLMKVKPEIFGRFKNKEIPKPSTDSLIRIGERRLQMQEILISLTRLSGGFTGFLETPDKANDVYSQILYGINRRYSIGYYPTNQERSDRMRKVKIEVRGHPEYIIWGRKSYAFQKN